MTGEEERNLQPESWQPLAIRQSPRPYCGRADQPGTRVQVTWHVCLTNHRPALCQYTCNGHAWPRYPPWWSFLHWDTWWHLVTKDACFSDAHGLHRTSARWGGDSTPQMSRTVFIKQPYRATSPHCCTACQQFWQRLWISGVKITPLLLSTIDIRSISTAPLRFITGQCQNAYCIFTSSVRVDL